MGKIKDFRCNVCEKGFDTDQFLINHFHTDHPDDGLVLWDSIGRTGYVFADIVVQKYRVLNDELRKSNEEYRKTLDAQERRLRNALCDLELIRRVLEAK